MIEIEIIKEKPSKYTLKFKYNEDEFLNDDVLFYELNLYSEELKQYLKDKFQCNIHKLGFYCLDFYFKTKKMAKLASEYIDGFITMQILMDENKKHFNFKIELPRYIITSQQTANSLHLIFEGI